MALSTEQYTVMLNAFMAVSNSIHGKRDTNKFLKACAREFGNSDVVEYRKNFTVVLERNDEQEIHAYSGNSDRFYKLGNSPKRAIRKTITKTNYGYLEVYHFAAN